ncbi:MAG TPA: hypothetical protein VFG53_16320 [Anaeromyxobacter sp.]|nr:hypothetical protein [Anaeromyxobacter sp.]
MRLDASPSLALAVALATASCGGSQPDEGVQGVQEMRLVLETDAPFTEAADFQSRLHDTIDVALSYWGGSWSDLNGRTITIVDAPSVECGGGSALGCFDGNVQLTTRDPGLGTFVCIEETVLVHEIGHAVLGDPDHTDPRWMQMDSVAAALSGREGYSSEGLVPCVPYVSVWRHPLDAP